MVLKQGRMIIKYQWLTINKAQRAVNCKPKLCIFFRHRQRNNIFTKAWLNGKLKL